MADRELYRHLYLTRKYELKIAHWRSALRISVGR